MWLSVVRETYSRDPPVLLRASFSQFGKVRSRSLRSSRTFFIWSSTAFMTYNHIAPQRSRFSFRDAHGTFGQMADDWRALLRSPMGCSAAAAVAVAPKGDDPVADHRGRPRHAKPQRPKAADAVPARMCWHCGIIGEHRHAHDCIDALRSMLALRAIWSGPRRGGRPKGKRAAAG